MTYRTGETITYKTEGSKVTVTGIVTEALETLLLIVIKEDVVLPNGIRLMKAGESTSISISHPTLKKV